MWSRRAWAGVLLAGALLTACTGTDQADMGEGGGEGPAPPVDVDDGSREEPGGEDLDDGGEVDDRQVVLRASLDLVVDDTDATVEAIRDLAAGAGGFVAAADLRRDEEGRQLAGTVTLRVPADRLDPVLESLADLAQDVRARTIASEDVTTQAVDLAARLTNLRAYEQELVALLAEVRTRPTAGPEELLAVFDRISQTRGEIERLQAQRDVLTDLVDLATVTVHLTPSESATPLSDPWSPAEIARQAVRTLVGVLQGLAAGAIWLVVVPLPLLAGAGIVVLLARKALRGRRRRAG